MWDESACAGAALSATFLSELRVLASLLCVHVRTRQSFPLSEACFLDLGRLGTPAPRAKSKGQELSPLGTEVPGFKERGKQEESPF